MRVPPSETILWPATVSSSPILGVCARIFQVLHLDFGEEVPVTFVFPQVVEQCGGLHFVIVLLRLATIFRGLVLWLRLFLWLGLLCLLLLVFLLLFLLPLFLRLLRFTLPLFR